MAMPILNELLMRNYTMRQIKFLMAIAVLVLSSNAGANDLKTCAAISDAAERLFCYDQLANGISPTISKPAAPLPAAKTVTETTPQQIVPPTATPVATRATVSPSPTTPTPVTSTPEIKANEDTFGMELELARRGPDKIQSNYVGYFKGTKGTGTKFTLENGQVWEQITSGRLTKKGEGVTMIVERGALGSYRLSVKGSNRSVRVKRVK